MRENLIGQKFGRLKVISLNEERSNRKSYWVCQCDCGNVKTVRSDSLKNGSIQSCGCLHKEQAIINISKNHKHKESKTRLYTIFQGMKDRCYNSNSKIYINYGGRGITICDDWLENYECFRDWAINNGYSDNLSIDRIDVNGNYEPSNCRWADNKTQCRNRRSNIIVQYNNKKITLIELSEITGIDYNVLSSRYERGDRDDRLIRNINEDNHRYGSYNGMAIINEDIAKEIRYLLNNTDIKQSEIAKKYNVSKYLVYDIKRNKTWKYV